MRVDRAARHARGASGAGAAAADCDMNALMAGGRERMSTSAAPARRNELAEGAMLARRSGSGDGARAVCAQSTAATNPTTMIEADLIFR